MSLSNLFLKVGKFLVLYLVCGCMTFNFTIQMTLRHLLPMPTNKILECKDHQIYSKRSAKESLISVSSVIKNSSFDQRFLCAYGQTFLKFFGDDFLFPAQNISLLAVQLYRVRHKIFLLCQC